MIKSIPSLKFFGLFFSICLAFQGAKAVDRTFVPSNGNWNVAGNWSPSGIPAPTDDVLIPAGKNCTLNISLSRSGNISVANGGQLVVQQNFNQTGGNFSIGPSGIFNISGIQLTFTNGCNVTGLLTVNSNTDLVFNSCPAGTTSPQLSGPVRNVSFANLSIVDLGFDLTSLGIMTVGSGNVLNVGNHKLGITTTSGSGEIIFSSGLLGSTVEYLGAGDLSVSSLNVKSLIFSRAGTITLGGTIVLADMLQINAGCTIAGTGLVSVSPFGGSAIEVVNNGTFSLSSGGSSLSTGTNGSFVNNGIVNQVGTLNVNGQFENYGDFNFTGGHAVTIVGSLFNGPGGKINSSGINPSLTINISNSGQFINHGLVKTGSTALITISSDLSNGFENLSTGTIDLACPINFNNGNTGINNSGTIIFNPGEFRFTGTGNPIIYLPKNLTFNDITVNKTAGSLSLSGPGKLLIKGSVNVNAGTFDLGGKSVVLISNLEGTARIGPIVGTLANSNNITVQRYIGGNSQGWYFMGTSVTGQGYSGWNDNIDISGPFPGAGLNTSADRSTVYIYDGAAPPTGPSSGEINGWRVPTSGSIVNGLGYRVFLKSKFFTGTKMYDNTGDVVRGNFSFPVTFNAQGYSGGGWNFLSNPYPSQIDWNSPGWTKTNIGGTIYIWNGATNQYGAYNFANDPPGSNPGTNGVSNIIASGQAFFIRATGPSPLLQATESVKSVNTNNFIRTAGRYSSYFRITLSNNSGKKDDNIIRFHDLSSPDYDADVDAQKMSGSYLNLSSLTPSGTKLCINTMPRVLYNAVIVPLVASTFTNDTQFSLTFSELGSDAQSINIFLKDKYLNTITLIQEGFVYKYFTNSDIASKGENRFELLMTKAHYFSEKIETRESNLLIYQDPGNAISQFIKIVNPKPEIGKILIFDPAGRIVHEMETGLESEIVTSVPHNLKPGVYCIEFRQNGVNLRAKAFIGQ